MSDCRTTHYEGCACHEARHAAEVAALRERLAALEPVVRAAVRLWACPTRALCEQMDDAVDALPEALRKEFGG